MKLQTVFTLLSLFIVVVSHSQIEDDIFYSPKKKPKPIKDRHMYTAGDQRIPEEDHSLYFYSSTINSYWDARNKEDEVYLYIFLEGQEYEATGERPILNLSFVIDRSGSMQGEKIQYTKKAMEFALTQLSEKDMISVVQYNESIDVLFEPKTGSDIELMKRKISEINATGSTNLYGGMEQGFKLVKHSFKGFSEIKNIINRVILLSDGLANVGIVNNSEIKEKTKLMYQEDNLTISTIGVGAEYNEDLMTGIAQEGGGLYHFISEPEQLQAIFETEFSGLKSLIAKNTRLEITYPTDKVSFNKVYEYPFSEKDNKIIISLTDFFAEEQRAILLKFNVKKDCEENELGFTTSLRYDNVVNEKELYSFKDVKIKATKNQNDLDQGINADAHMGYTLMMSTALLKQAQKAVDNRSFTQAEELTRQGMEILDEHFRVVVPNPFLEEVYENFKDYKKEIPVLEKTKDSFTFKIKQKGYKHRNYGSYRSARFL